MSCRASEHTAVAVGVTGNRACRSMTEGILTHGVGCGPSWRHSWGSSFLFLCLSAMFFTTLKNLFMENFRHSISLELTPPPHTHLLPG